VVWKRRKMKEVHGYGVIYHRYVNEHGNKCLQIFVYYQGTPLKHIFFCNGIKMLEDDLKK